MTGVCEETCRIVTERGKEIDVRVVLMNGSARDTQEPSTAIPGKTFGSIRPRGGSFVRDRLRQEDDREDGLSES